MLLNNNIKKNKPEYQLFFLYYLNFFSDNYQKESLNIFRLIIFLDYYKINEIIYINKIIKLGKIFKINKYKNFIYYIHKNKNIISLYNLTNNSFIKYTDLIVFYFNSLSRYNLMNFLEISKSKDFEIIIIKLKRLWSSTFFFNILFKLKNYQSIFFVLIILGIKFYNINKKILKIKNDKKIFKKYFLINLNYKYGINLNLFFKDINSFSNWTLIQILLQLYNYPLISYNYIYFIKWYKIYRICQRKEIFNKNSNLKILHIWSIREK